jgi:hypothetical protein
MMQRVFEREMAIAGYQVPNRQALPKVQGFTAREQSLKAVEEERQEEIMQDFLGMSESSLSKIWLDPEEDEAWQDL